MEKDLYSNLLEVIQPYMWDFCGYDEESQCFDIVLAVREILEVLSDGGE